MLLSPGRLSTPTLSLPGIEINGMTAITSAEWILSQQAVCRLFSRRNIPRPPSQKQQAHAT